MKRIIFVGGVILLNYQIVISQTSLKQFHRLTPDKYRDEQFSNQDKIIPAAERINVYLPLIKGKKVGIFANHTSTVGSGHLVDTLQKLGVDIRVIFGPEHGFRGTIPDGVKIAEIKEDVVVLDANHPLAGEELVFDIELVEIVGNKPLIIMP